MKLYLALMLIVASTSVSVAGQCQTTCYPPGYPGGPSQCTTRCF
jgi:hypothetical protein